VTRRREKRVNTEFAENAEFTEKNRTTVLLPEKVGQAEVEVRKAAASRRTPKFCPVSRAPLFFVSVAFKVLTHSCKWFRINTYGHSISVDSKWVIGGGGGRLADERKCRPHNVAQVYLPFSVPGR
jgi:hypothetical protein